jgi:oligopeptide transport system substrate-binding protein
MRFLFVSICLMPILIWGNVFKIPYQNELTEINPLNLRSASGAYIHHALFRNLLWINEKNEVVPDLAENCRWKNPKKLHCKLKKNLKWSNGEPLTAKDFEQSYEFLLNSKSNFTRKEILFNVVGAKKYAQGTLASFSEVGIKAKDDLNLEFTLDDIDPELEYKLALPMSTPVKQKNFNVNQPLISSGPYRIKSFDSKSLEIKMESNPNFHIQTKRPDLSFVFISDDSIQVPLFSKNQIDLVRRVPTAQIPQWKGDKSFKGLEVLRFDYFGFNLSKIDKTTRIAMASVIDYNELQTLLNSTGRPGCFDFSAHALDKSICFDIKKSKVKLPTLPTTKLELVYSHLGGEDHHRAGEWLKSEWKKYLDVDVSLKQLENKVFVNTLKTELPAIFRKGVPLETPLCYSAIKIFEEGNPENLYNLSDSFLKRNIAKIKKEKSLKKQKVLCNAILEYVKENAFIIPTGRYELSILLRDPYRNLKFNRLNMIDFSQY